MVITVFVLHPSKMLEMNANIDLIIFVLYTSQPIFLNHYGEQLPKLESIPKIDKLYYFLCLDIKSHYGQLYAIVHVSFFFNLMNTPNSSLTFF